MISNKSTIIIVAVLCLFSKNLFSDESNKIYNEGVRYLFGNGVEVDEKRACDLFEKSASYGNILAQYNLGHCYRKGDGRDFDIKKAEYWFTKSSDKGYIGAKINLVALYLFDFKEFDTNYVLSLLKDSISGGDPVAYFLMGYACHKNIDLSCGDKDAIGYYEYAASKAHSLSILLLYYIYENGIYGVSKDTNKASKWLKDFDLVIEISRVPGQDLDSGIKSLREKGFID